MPTRFIAIEGGDGLGKTNQAERLVFYLREQERIRNVYLYSFPNYQSHVGRLIKMMLEDGTAKETSPFAMGMLFAADIFATLAGMAFHDADWVVFDRFSLSNLVYQGARAELLNAEHEALKYNHVPWWLSKVNSDVFHMVEPYYIILDGPIRPLHRSAIDTYDSDLTLQRKVREMYREYAQRYPDDATLINTSDGLGNWHSPDYIQEAIVYEINKVYRI